MVSYLIHRTDRRQERDKEDTRTKGLEKQDEKERGGFGCQKACLRIKVSIMVCFVLGREDI